MLERQRAEKSLRRTEAYLADAQRLTDSYAVVGHAISIRKS